VAAALAPVNSAVRSAGSLLLWLRCVRVVAKQAYARFQGRMTASRRRFCANLTQDVQIQSSDGPCRL
jgi:hypothetical protein